MTAVPSQGLDVSSYWPGRYRGRVVLVTGAAGGLGGAAVERLRAENAVVVATDRVGADQELDVTSEEQWERVCAQVLAEHGRIDGLLLAHGAQGPEVPVEEVDPADWRRTLSINLDSCFLGLRAVLPSMKRAGYGRVVALSSISGREGNASMTAYSTSKAGVIALVKAAAKESASQGVCINAVAPSMFQTPLLQHLSAERNAELLSRVPAGRIGQPAEFAALAAWLLSEECSYTTGQVLDLSGGRYSGS
ncbi:SDR family NAD(P)-dependent oxidoreductase [Citricoccus muralis]|uniref:SDR family NAD(P)-dependent oxidoreductase n=1 Tax=Citricoccus muralis TaxID=169134 RepID=A0ABY8H7N6_9MICC|nr:SDR family NAD(P)-dependent oxidoreductase [Citricoccus muralis]WFP16844.1 SDR family NAD(P)-dependent oxidoreductase [Citricoccus muralis]